MGRHVAPQRDRPSGVGADGELRTGPPVSVEVALRRVRTLAAVLVAVRLLASESTRASLSVPFAVGIAGCFLAVNLVSLIAQRNGPRVRTALGVVQVVADTVLVLAVLWVRQDDSPSADWAILVLPVLEGAIRFQLVGAVASWVAVAGGYVGWNVLNGGTVELSDIAQRMTVVFLVALPSGFLAEHLVAEIAAHRKERDDAEHRGALLRAAALGGRRSTSLDVDEILEVLRDTVGQMGFADPTVFEVEGKAGSPGLLARPVRHSGDVLAIPPGDARLAAGALARDRATAVVWPPDAASAPQPAPPRSRRAAPAPAARYSVLVGVPVSLTGDTAVVITARWPAPGAPPAAQCESLELFASQAGASLRNAQVHRELQGLKDRLAHEAAHDALTDLPNRRRFHEQLERVCGRGRAGDLVSVLFLDLDGFKEVNDRYGHDQGNALLVAVAKRLRSCVRPGDVVARMGGDEFTVMLTRLESPAPAIEVAERICAVLTEPFELGPDTVRVSTSIGIALAPADRADSGDLVRRADVAMYRAKSQGKAGWALDPGSLDAAADPAAPSAGPTPNT
jgi:diguanylate cyclase (GGDEF)-like protein